MPIRRAMWALIAALIAAAPARADEPFIAFGDAMVGGKLSLDVRYRFEYVDQVGISRTAKAHTVRTRLGYETGSFYDFKGFAEVESLFGIGRKRYNDTVKGDARYPVVADPDNTEANRYWISYAGLPETTIKGGRQRIKLDNDRFVGNVGFRQNEQTYDAVRLTSKIVPDLTADYAFVWLVNRIFGEDARQGDWETNTHLVNLAYGGLGFVKVIGYAYLLDFDDVPANSSKTFGLRLTGSHALAEPWKLLYTAEGAWQSDHANNPNDNSFAYYLIEPGIAYDTLSLKLGYEVLTGNGRRAFQTPLATLHAFQGWADKFLTTPGGGIEDAYVRLDYTAKGLAEWLDGTKLTAVYHNFDAEEGSTDYGSEVDLELTRTLFDHFTVGLKYASYDADTFATGTDKLWATLTIKY